LGHVASYLLQRGRLLLGLHPSCYDLHPEGVRQPYDHPHELRILRVPAQTPDKGFVYLDGVCGQALEVGKSEE